MDRRQARLEARTRGSALRDVQVEALNIHQNEPSKPKLLESALVKSEDIENLPRLRQRRSDEHSRDEDELLDELVGDIPAEKSRRRSNIPLYSDDESDGRHTPQKEARETAATKKKRKSTSKSPAVKKKRGRPRKVLTQQEQRLQDERLAMPKRPRGRPKKGQEQRKHSTPFDYVTARPKKKMTKHRRIIYDPVVKKAAPLTQVKPRGGYKPLEVEIERLMTDTNKGKRYKVNTLDVLKHLILSFEPEPPAEPTSINTDIAHEEFRSHFMNHLGHLFDVHGSIDDLTYEINKVQKQKDELRSKIFELRKDHAAVGTELNGLRANFRSSKQNYEEFKSLAEGLDRLRHEVSASPTTRNMVDEIDQGTRIVGKIYNPTSGLHAKLEKVNTTLMTVDNELS